MSYMAKSNRTTKNNFKVLLILSILLILTAPVLYFVLGTTYDLNCPKTEYGSCEMSYAITSGLTVLTLASAWGVSGLILFAVGIIKYQSYKKKR